MLQKYYFDTSIWIDIYGERGYNGEVAKRLLQRIILQDSIVLYSDVLVVELKRLDFSDYEIGTLLKNKSFIYYIVLHSVTMETISVRFEESFVHDMEKVMKEHRYATKTEFIREAIRERIKQIETQEALLRLKKAYGAGVKKARKITDEDIHRAGEEAVKEIAKELGVSLD